MKQKQTRKAQLNKEQREQIEDAVRSMRRKVEKNIEHRLKTEQDLESEPEEPEGDREILAKAVKREKDEDESWEKALDDYIKGVGYTIVNRLTALRSMEVRGFIDREVTEFKGGKTPAAEPIIDEEFETEQTATLLAYNKKCKELSEDLQILFDTKSPYHKLPPTYDVYKELCETLDEIDDSLWLADDVLGWVYEYYNADDLEEVREKAREEGLDAEDTTIANQFYTPHWVVRMLTDNSLGKLYLEENNNLLSAIEEQEDLSIEERQERSTHPSDTPRVEDLCTYLVPTEEQGESTDYDDPSEIRVIDPACGSGHFLLYAFDILERIWRDERPEIPNEKIPAKILENNIYGVDLDLRACQLASFNLYLKARTRAEDEGAENFQMPEVGIVCSDSSISNVGEAEELFEQVTGHQEELYNALENVLEEFEETDGLGSLLDVKGTLQELFDFEGEPLQLSMSDFQTQEDQERYRKLTSFLEDLHDEIEEKHNNGSFLTQDLQSFLRLVKILSQSYDVALMNPPYGSGERMPDQIKEYTEEHYKYSSEYYINFFEVCNRLLKQEGRTGMLVPRSFTYKRRFREFREDFVGGQGYFDFLAEQGYDILDNATVATVTATVRKTEEANSEGSFIRLHDVEKGKKEGKFIETIQEQPESRIYKIDVEEFSKVPGSPICYYTPEKMRNLHDSEYKLDPSSSEVSAKGVAEAKQGMATGNNFRFLRYHWEANNIEEFSPYAKGGSDSWLLPQTRNLVEWGEDGENLRRVDNSVLRNSEYYFREGLTWTYIKRSGRRFGYLNGFAFDVAGSMLFPNNISPWKMMGALNTDIYHGLFLALTPERDWQIEIVGRMPWFKELEDLDALEENAKEQYRLMLENKQYDAKSPFYRGPEALPENEGFFYENKKFSKLSRGLNLESEELERDRSLEELIESVELEKTGRRKRIEELADENEKLVMQALDLDETVLEKVREEIFLRTTETREDRVIEDPDISKADLSRYVKDLLHHFAMQIVQEKELIALSKESDDEDPDLMDHVVEKFEDVWGEYADERLAEADQILGDERSGEEAYPNIRDWLENDLFEFHLREFENTPILWKITTERMVQEPKSEGFACIVDYHQLDSGIFDKLKDLMEPRKSALRENRKDADRRRSDGSLSADEQSKAVEEYERCDDALRQIDEFESTIRELGEDNPRDWSKEDQELAENLVPKVREFRTRTKKRLKTLDRLKGEAGADWLEDMFSPTFFDRVDENCEEWIDALQDLEKACKEYSKDAGNPVEAHLYDLFVYLKNNVGSTHHGSNDITFLNHYFSKGDKFLDNGEPREGLSGKEELMAELASETDEDVELAKEIKETCSEIESHVSSDWKDRAIQEVTVEGYKPVKKHGVAINIEPLAEKSIVPEIVEDKVI